MGIKQPLIFIVAWWKLYRE